MASRAPSSSSATPPSPSAPRTATSTASRTARCWRAWSGRGLGRDATPWLPIWSAPVNLVRWRAARDRSARRAPVLPLANAHLLTLIGKWEQNLEPGFGRHLSLLSDRSSVRPASSPQAQHPPSKQTTYLLLEVSLPVTGRLQRSQIPSDLVLLWDTPLLRPAPEHPGSNHPSVVSLTPETRYLCAGAPDGEAINVIPTGPVL